MDAALKPELGRDELNLAEFPIALLTNGTDRKLKTLVFEGEYGKLTVLGSEKYGLPNAGDSDVIVGLIQLTRQQNGFTHPTVTFTKYDLINILRWNHDGQHNRRLNESLRRWCAVTLEYEKGWWDNSVKCRIDASFHILDSVILFDQETRRNIRAQDRIPPPCSFTWNTIFLDSCRADNLKTLDLGVYFSLRSSVSKRAYRVLDKRFYLSSTWTFPLREFAFGHVGLSRGYTDAKIKEKLKPALEELKSIGFVGEVGYSNPKRAGWQITIRAKKAKRAKGQGDQTETG
jgi:hypothetical protein